MNVCATPPRMKRLIPLPIPHPFWIISSSRSTIMLASKSWKNMTNDWASPRAPERPADDVGAGLDGYHYEGQDLRGRAEDGPVVGVPEVELQEVASLQQLQDEPGRDDGADAELHQRALARSEDYPEERELVGLVAVVVERRDRHRQVEDEREAGPDELLREAGLLLGLRNLRQNRRDALDEVSEGSQA